MIWDNYWFSDGRTLHYAGWEIHYDGWIIINTGGKTVTTGGLSPEPDGKIAKTGGCYFLHMEFLTVQASFVNLRAENGARRVDYLPSHSEY